VTAASREPGKTSFRVLAAISFCHLLNDMLQSLIAALYPIIKASLYLDFGQIGLITLTNQLTASLLQPVVGAFTDRRPQPFSLAAGMAVTLAGVITLASAGTFSLVLIAVALVGVGSAVFHPESSRVARMASGGQHGLAQSLFQVGGNPGSALGPLLAAVVVAPRGQSSVAWFSGFALTAMAILARVGIWYRVRAAHSVRHAHHPERSPFPRRKIAVALAVLIALIFSKYIYLASLSSYYTFYLISKFGVSVQSAQMYLFLFLGAVASGTFIGGPVGDRIGRKYVIWASILGVLPFSLALPHVGLLATAILSVMIGLILASAFSAILVYAQELLPGNIGMISGLFFGFAFGIAGLGAAVLGQLADATSIEFVYRVCSVLPAIGLLAAFLPHLDRDRS
jgi:FSR family fosmidomycin resistance protein-like MFS transporter